MIRKHCPDRDFPDCLCSTCRAVCSCLDYDRMGLSCPICSCPGYKIDQTEIEKRKRGVKNETRANTGLEG